MRATSAILGCHVVGEWAAEIVQVAAIAIAAKMPVHELARIPFSFPTYAGVLGRRGVSRGGENPRFEWCSITRDRGADSG